jgi:hypothetical protein
MKTSLNLTNVIVMQGNVSSDLIIWGVLDTSANADGLNGGGHVNNTAAATDEHNPLTTEIHKSGHFNPTHIPVGSGRKSPPHPEYGEKESEEIGRTNTLYEGTLFPQVCYGLREKSRALNE